MAKDDEVLKCYWGRSFDGHFNISCVETNWKRANGNFKPDNSFKDTKWDFKYCPYCGDPIEIREYHEKST